jgi:hypothetical protein
VKTTNVKLLNLDAISSELVTLDAPAMRAINGGKAESHGENISRVKDEGFLSYFWPLFL